MSMIVHQAPRRLKLGETIGKAIAKFGRSMIAGCKRSTQLARLYTVGGIKQLARLHNSVQMYQHVDDVSNLVADESKQNAVVKTLRFAINFATMFKDLHLEISTKTTVVPDNESTRKVARILTQSGIPMKTDKAGVDIGVDTAAGQRRSIKKQSGRIKETKKNAGRIGVLAKINSKAKRLAVTGAKPKQTYGYTAIGMSPTFG